jgi:hypothetical protein
LAVNFFLLAHTAQRAGVAVAALASRLSVAIPSLLAFVLYDDTLTPVKLPGYWPRYRVVFMHRAGSRQRRS